VAALDVVMSDAAIVARLDALATEARDLADEVSTREHLQPAALWIQQTIMGASGAHDQAKAYAQDPDEEVVHRARMLGHYIWTHSGGRFFPQDPKPEEVKLEDIAYSLARRNRWTAHADPAITVDRHSLMVAVIARLIAEEEGVDTEQAYLYGLVHDAHEAYLPHVARPIARYMGSELAVMLAATQDAILEALEIPPPSPVIAAIVSAADDYALRLEAEALFPDTCDPGESRVGRDPPARLREAVVLYGADGRGGVETLVADNLALSPFGNWYSEVNYTLKKIRAWKPEPESADSWKDQAVKVEGGTQEYCMICERDSPPLMRRAVQGGLCAECLGG